MMVIKAVCSFECIAFFNDFDKEVICFERVGF